jgi:hypothetical protein
MPSVVAFFFINNFRPPNILFLVSLSTVNNLWISVSISGKVLIQKHVDWLIIHSIVQ